MPSKKGLCVVSTAYFLISGKFSLLYNLRVRNLLPLFGRIPGPLLSLRDQVFGLFSLSPITSFVAQGVCLLLVERHYRYTWNVGERYSLKNEWI